MVWKRMFCLKFLICTHYTWYFKDDRVCFTLHIFGVMKSLQWQFYLNLHFHPFQKSMQSFIGQSLSWTSNSHREDGCRMHTVHMFTCKHFHMFTFWMLGIHQFSWKRKIIVIKSQAKIFCVNLLWIGKIKNVFHTCHIILHHWLFLWP